MSSGRFKYWAALTGAAALALAGCSAQTDDGEGEGEATGGTVRVAETNIFFSFNPDHADNNMDINSKVVGATRSDWQYINPDLELVKDESFGTFERTSEDPLTVEYTINEDMAWSDGNKLDKADMLLQWAIWSGHFDSASDEGPKFFAFAGDTSGLGLTDLPEFDGEQKMTLTYSEPYVDWEIAFGMGTAQPAHVVAERAGLESEEALVELLETAKPGKKNPQLQKVADVWNNDFNTKTLPKEESLYLSSGPMIVSEMVEDQSLTLVKNEAYKGDNAARVDEITVSFIGDASAQVAALRNGEVDIIAPQATTDTTEQITALDGVEMLEGSQLAYDHVDLSFKTDVFKDENVRKAFLKTIPRQDIVDKLIKPMYEDAEVVNSQLYLPSEGDKYTESVDANGSSEYAEVDIAGAKELLNGATPTVRILYNSENPVRVDAFQMIQESASQAGFKIVDGGDKDWGAKLTGDTYDASLFGWVSSGVGNAGIPQLFDSQGGGNYSGYSSDKVDELNTQLMTEIDADAAEEIKRQIDAELWADAFGAPLFQSPGVVAYSDAVSGLEYMPNQTGVWWNFWEWGIEN
jgi:peptide/nickel transport system substrate-binding protein